MHVYIFHFTKVIRDTLPSIMGVGEDPEDLPMRRGILFGEYSVP